ncbi:flagellar hook-basal body protein [Cohnella thailandensis]|uniref:Flagellar hook-basal body protein n=1 Tax=Cohnella thailandensis TaxID=557557 RepID=A0A841T567_9BACL|nr:flagellar hook-basal body protein [Cohnella thailandensis]MBB6638119.1 flagellar hook-basal body protein [Cohnella thailandensis]MBP1971954.1 flagellar basal-body rod protein FlgG [Cohnella thailandensis]
MNNSMISAAASMGAMQQKLDILADNISNINTDGYKRKNAVFEDILTNIQPHEDSFLLEGRRSPLGFTQGWGARVVAQTLDMTQGPLKATGLETDVAIEGNALFEVRSGMTIDSERAFTRQGAFQLMPTENGNRILVTNSGYPVVASNGTTDTFVNVPEGYKLVIADDGTITATSPDNLDSQQLGSLKLVEVLKPELLQAVADNMYGVPIDVNAGDVVQTVTATPNRTDGVAIRQGSLEQSNVSLADEMADLVTVQRAYQLNARALTSADQMMQMATDLRG